MPDLQDPPKAPDWDLIQARYVQGVGPTELARIFGVKADTISVRATRKGWQRLKQKQSKPCQTVTVTTERAEAEAPKLTAQSDRTRTALADLLVRSAETLAAMPLLTASRALRVNQDAESMVRNAKTVFGWNDGQSQPSVRINVLSSFSVQPQVDAQPVIECESVPASLPQESESSASDTKPQ